MMVHSGSPGKKRRRNSRAQAGALDLLVRGRFTRPQGGLRRKERRKNVRGAFTLRKGLEDRVKGKTIVLVDDVFTTGATLNECTRALMKAGAAEIRCLCIARVTNDALNKAGLKTDLDLKSFAA